MGAGRAHHRDAHRRAGGGHLELLPAPVSDMWPLGRRGQLPEAGLQRGSARGLCTKARLGAERRVQSALQGSFRRWRFLSITELGLGARTCCFVRFSFFVLVKTCIMFRCFFFFLSFFPQPQNKLNHSATVCQLFKRKILRWIEYFANTKQSPDSIHENVHFTRVNIAVSQLMYDIF